MTDVFEQINASFPLLGWALQFYFSSAILVLLALVPVACRLIEMLASRKILRLGFARWLGVVTTVGRIGLIVAVLIVGGAISVTSLLSVGDWIDVGEAIAAGAVAGGMNVVIQFLTGAVLFWGIATLLRVWLTEERVAKLIERVQRDIPPGKVRIVLLAMVNDWVVWPVLLIYVLHIVTLI